MAVVYHGAIQQLLRGHPYGKGALLDPKPLHHKRDIFASQPVRTEEVGWRGERLRTNGLCNKIFLLLSSGDFSVFGGGVVPKDSCGNLQPLEHLT